MTLSLILAIVGFISYSLIFFKLVTTNHWSTGKKLLVLLVFSIMAHYSVLTLTLLGIWSMIAGMTSLPVSIVGLIMVSLFYRLEDIEH